MDAIEYSINRAVNSVYDAKISAVKEFTDVFATVLSENPDRLLTGAQVAKILTDGAQEFELLWLRKKK